jgi:hypothetical protein
VAPDAPVAVDFDSRRPVRRIRCRGAEQVPVRLEQRRKVNGDLLLVDRQRVAWLAPARGADRFQHLTLGLRRDVVREEQPRVDRDDPESGQVLLAEVLDVARHDEVRASLDCRREHGLVLRIGVLQLDRLPREAATGTRSCVGRARRERSRRRTPAA